MRRPKYSTGPETEILLQVLLKGTFLREFHCCSYFDIHLERDQPSVFHGHALPVLLKLGIYGDWWFGERASWQARVRELVPDTVAEKDAPLQAFELAAHYWSDGNDIIGVELNDGHLVLTFGNSATLMISPMGDGIDDIAWEVDGPDGPEGYPMWRAYCDGVDVLHYMPGPDR